MEDDECDDEEETKSMHDFIDDTDYSKQQGSFRLHDNKRKHSIESDPCGGGGGGGEDSDIVEISVPKKAMPPPKKKYKKYSKNNKDDNNEGGDSFEDDISNNADKLVSAVVYEHTGEECVKVDSPSILSLKKYNILQPFSSAINLVYVNFKNSFDSKTANQISTTNSYFNKFISSFYNMYVYLSKQRPYTIYNSEVRTFLNYLIINGYRTEENPYNAFEKTSILLRWTYEYKCLMYYFEQINAKDSAKSDALFSPYFLYRKLTSFHTAGYNLAETDALDAYNNFETNYNLPLVNLLSLADQVSRTRTIQRRIINVFFFKYCKFILVTIASIHLKHSTVAKCNFSYFVKQNRVHFMFI